MLARRTGTLTNGSPVITGLKRTDDLFVGENIYGDGIPVCAVVISVDSGTEITMSADATVDGDVELDFTPASPDMVLERCCMLRDIYDIVWERGEAVKVVLRDEDEVSRGRYNSITSRTDGTIIQTKAYPVDFSPSQKQLEKAGLREACDVSVWIPAKSFYEAGIEFEDIEFSGKTTVVLRGTTYEVREKSMSVQVADAYGYIIFGLFRR